MNSRDRPQPRVAGPLVLGWAGMRGGGFPGGVIRQVKLAERPGHIPGETQEIVIQRKLARTALDFLRDNHAARPEHNAHLQNLQRRLEVDFRYSAALSGDGQRELPQSPMTEHQGIDLEVLDRQKDLLHRMNHRSEFDEELIRKYLPLLDPEEIKLREKRAQPVGISSR